MKKKLLKYLTYMNTFRNVFDCSGKFLKNIIYAQLKTQNSAYSSSICLDWKLSKIVATSDIWIWIPYAALNQTVFLRII